MTEAGRTRSAVERPGLRSAGVSPAVFRVDRDQQIAGGTPPLQPRTEGAGSVSAGPDANRRLGARDVFKLVVDTHRDGVLARPNF
jgi:hypothetical protein